MGADFRLDGRVALVTGSARNLGYEIARAYAEAGARVYLNGTDEERLWAAVDRLAAEGVRVHSALFDVTDEPAAAAQIERIFNECGRFDILVNNVGIRMREPITAIDSAGLRRMLDVHVVAAFALSRLVAPLMASSGYGRIVNLG
ncbi:MAG: SDR family NAD(P)-dependent oxidoreductase, partial [Novosphingobium sp.]|nr:SDR family NAD(P)-dependent oxidoreductase [Novosphingobium sp.]